MKKYRMFKVIKRHFLLCITAMIALVLFFYLEHNARAYSLVINKSNELSDSSIHVLKQVSNKKISVDVYANAKSMVAKKIKQFFEPFLYNHNNLHLKFIDPISHPKEVQENAITMQGELVIKLGEPNSNDKINVTELSESSIINAILSLHKENDDWIVIGEGFGMSKIEDESPQGLSDLLVHLKKSGYKVARMILDSSIVLPDNVKLIVLPAPIDDIGKNNAEWLNNQLNNAVSVWWLNDLEVKDQLNLELVLNVMSSGVVELENNKLSGYVSNFTQHQITENFNQPLYIAQAIEIIAENFTSLILTPDNKTIAVSKQLQNSRLVITGDADFIKNQYLNAAANKSMAIRIVDWLLLNDDRINVPVRINENTQLLLSKNQLLVLGLLLLVIIPITFLTFAIFQWRKSRD